MRARMLLAAMITIGCVATSAAPVGADPDPSGSVPAAEHVVLIGFDGFDPDYLGRAPTPNIDALAARGVMGTTSAVMLPITNPSFTAISTGAWPENNGNLAYWWDRHANVYRGQSRATVLPSIAEVVRDAGGTVGSAQYFIFQANGADYGEAEGLYTQPGGACGRRFDDAIDMLHQRPVDSAGSAVTVPQIPTLLAVYCDDLDAIGHAEGAESPNIPDALTELDAQVGRLVAELDTVGIADSTTIVLTGDHGMSSYDKSFALDLNGALSNAGYSPSWLFSNGQAPSSSADVVLTSTGRSLAVYLAGTLEGDDDALAEVRSIIEGVDGVGGIIERSEFPGRHIHPGYGDLIVEAAPGWGTSILPPSGTVGDHGSAAEQDAVFLAAGAGIAPVTDPVTVRHIDIAPTIAELLGVGPMPDADGSVLRRLLAGDDEPPEETTTTTSTTVPDDTTTTTTIVPDGSSTTTSTTVPAGDPSTTTTSVPEDPTTVADQPDRTGAPAHAGETDDPTPRTGPERPADPATPVRAEPDYIG